MPDNVLSSELTRLENELSTKNTHLDLLTQIAIAATEPGTVGHLVRRALELICRANGWVIGQFWIVKENQNSVVCSDWYFATKALPQFREASTDRKMSKGIGLPGRAWSTALPVLIPEIDKELGLAFTRKVAATESGIKSGFAFALKNGPFVTAVCEFFKFEAIELNKSDMLFYEKLGIYLANLIAQREAERALGQQQALYKIVLDHAYNAFICINEASLITEWSTRAEEVFGWEKDDVLGKSLVEAIIPERYRDAHIRGLFRYMTTGEGPVLNQPITVPALHRNGTEIKIELLIFPIEGIEAKRFGAFVIDLSKPRREPIVQLD